MSETLNGRTIAFLVSNEGAEQVELTEPWQAVEAAAGKPVAVICHGPWTLVEADVVRDRSITSWPSLQTDLRNSGANWKDEEVVVDGNLVTSRKPDDLPAFNEAAVAAFAG